MKAFVRSGQTGVCREAEVLAGPEVKVLAVRDRDRDSSVLPCPGETIIVPPTVDRKIAAALLERGFAVQIRGGMQWD